MGVSAMMNGNAPGMAGYRPGLDGLRRSAGRTGLLAAGLVLFAAGCGDKAKPVGAPAERPVVAGVEIVTVASSPAETVAEVVGTVRAAAVAAIAPRLMGRITAVNVAEGSRVEKGALLATIEDDAAVAQLASAEGAVAEAQAGREEAERSIAQAEANRSLAEKTFERYRTLLEQRVVARQEFDEIETRRIVAVKDHERALEKRAQAAARLVQARAGADAARTALVHTKITAPFSGIVTEKRADAGSMAVPGTPILVMEDTRRYRIEASIPETYLGTVKAGTRVRVLLDSRPAAPVSAVVSEVTPLVDPATRTFTARADLPGPGLRTGLFGRIRFVTGKTSLLAVPRGAISGAGGSEAVFAVTPDNVARLVLVTTGDRSGDNVVILSGIEPGARIAASRLDALVDGVRVEAAK